MLAETICSAVSAAGLGIAAVTAYRRRFLRAVRIAAYALVPVALVLTGVVQWLSGVVFKPTVWIGFGLLALAWVLFLATRALERRGAAGEAGAAKPRGAVAPAASAPALGGGAAGPSPTPRSAPAEDFSDIEAILKKHGI
ncbi:hypothetical protein EDD96_3322 [Streptomyces sp. Ag109_G2-6]|uniref:hypothetical protein n=1 Tax=Streptomyces TaxID=1883 RepID=UPI0009A4EF62|nr:MULTISPECIES: hypothetical protein [Streptomyces]RPF39583.1 hypothetical protein EDD96_3322 [Streptomyces sp. Ag109_G2-6]